MRHLGVDWGSKRVGLAVSDESGKMAFPFGIVLNKNARFLGKELKKLAKKEGIGKIIVGLPLAFDGSETGESKRARAFAAKLKKETGLEIELENEILTSRLAERAGAEKRLIDSLAAAAILQSYLDKRRRNA